jgi:hypothetical protein
MYLFISHLKDERCLSLPAIGIKRNISKDARAHH